MLKIKFASIIKVSIIILLISLISFATDPKLPINPNMKWQPASNQPNQFATNSNSLIFHYPDKGLKVEIYFDPISQIFVCEQTNLSSNETFHYNVKYIRPNTERSGIIGRMNGFATMSAGEIHIDFAKLGDQITFFRTAQGYSQEDMLSPQTGSRNFQINFKGMNPENQNRLIGTLNSNSTFQELVSLSENSVSMSELITNPHTAPIVFNVLAKERKRLSLNNEIAKANQVTQNMLLLVNEAKSINIG